MAELLSIGQQQLAAEAKIDGMDTMAELTKLNALKRPRVNVTDSGVESDLMTKIGEVWSDIRRGDANLTKGAVAGNLGAGVDIVALATMVGYEGFNWASSGGTDPFEFSDTLDTPGGTDSIARAMFGKDTDVDSIQFLIGSLMTPGGIVKGGVTLMKTLGVAGALKAMFVGTAVVSKALTRPLSTARSMNKLGRSDSDIWQETGWGKKLDADGKPIMKNGEPQWTYHLSDADAVVDKDLIQQTALNMNLAVGAEETLMLKMGEVLQHPTLFDAYPRLRHIPLNVSVRRIKDVDGKQMFEIFNKDMFEEGVTASITRGVGQAELNLFGGGLDGGRKSILHETQHLIQTIEDWDGGANSAMFLERIFDLKNAQVDVAMKAALRDGTLARSSSDKVLADFADKLVVETRISDVGVLDRMYEIMRGGPDIINDMASASARVRRGVRDIEYMVQELNPKLHPSVANAYANQIMKNLGPQQAGELSVRRYYNQEGEIQARLTEMVSDLRQKEIQNLGGLIQSPEPLRAIRGDKARDAATGIKDSGPVVGDDFVVRDLPDVP